MEVAGEPCHEEGEEDGRNPLGALMEPFGPLLSPPGGREEEEKGRAVTTTRRRRPSSPLTPSLLPPPSSSSSNRRPQEAMVPRWSQEAPILRPQEAPTEGPKDVLPSTVAQVKIRSDP